MRQIQKQSQILKLALTQTMRNSLELLEMGPEEVAQAVQRERNRNAFLCCFPPGCVDGGVVHNGTESVAQETVLDDLGRQIGLMRLSTRQRQLAYGLLHSLDGRGFLSDSLEDIADYLDSSTAEIAELLPLLQGQVEPPGLFATSLAECFQLQLQARNRFDPLIRKLLGRLDLVSRKDIVAICAECGVDEEDAADMLEDIRGLDPAPLVEKQVLPQAQAAPEIIIREAPSGVLRAELNEAALPRILTDDALFSATIVAETDVYSQSYYRDCYRGAANMVRAMQKRANTLLATGNAIAKRQEKFVRTGRDRNKVPLTIEQISSEIGVNKSTVSRALRSCSIMTDLGIFPAQQFLARGLTPDQNGDKTREQALRRLSVLIKTEDQKEPTPDEQLMQQLGTLGFRVSRRTVAKYRKILGIPGAYRRKRQ